ncbi:MAG: hypothetical protein EAX96_05150 [Candidatus Lokiarchaeota archaeon]|nr:hypothetical protein [Candidatus Lokiarchaeota archaeon]
MSEITNVKTALKEIMMNFDDMNNIVTNTIPKLKENPDSMLKLIESFEELKKSKLSKIESMKNEIIDYKNKISQAKLDNAKLEEEIEDLDKKQQENIKKIENIKIELKDTTEKVAKQKEEFENRSQRLKDLETKVQELIKLKESSNERIEKVKNELESDFNKKSSFVESFQRRINAMRLLITKEYLKNAQVQVIKALQKDVKMEVSKVVLSSSINEDEVKKVLQKVVELQGPIEYDSVSGSVLLKQEVDF